MGSHNLSDSPQGQYRRKNTDLGPGASYWLCDLGKSPGLTAHLSFSPSTKAPSRSGAKGWRGSPQWDRGLGRCEHRSSVRLDTVSASVNLNLLLEVLAGVQPQPSLPLLSVPCAMALRGCLAPLKLLLGTLVLSFPWWKNYCNWPEQPPSISALTNEWVMMNEKEEKP